MLAACSAVVASIGGAGSIGRGGGPLVDSTLGLTDVVWQPEKSGFFVGSPSITTVVEKGAGAGWSGP